MEIAQRIQELRRAANLSQEELAYRTGVSRQAVSKWESAQSTPEIDKIIALSEIFGVSTDYLLKGEAPAQKAEDRTPAGKILHIAATAFLVIGLLCAVGAWFEEQTASCIWGGLLIQVVGAAGYCIAQQVCGVSAPLKVRWINLLLLGFLPLSVAVNALLGRVIGPYPTDILSGIVFAVLYTLYAVLSYGLLRRENKRNKA